MSDALLSPTVGGALWAASGAAVGWSARRIGTGIESRRIPLMGVLAAFVFAGQMINFTIPGAGSSGHLGGGMILAVLLGPHAAFLAMASILIVQALFFADGGLLALGCNIFNLGFIPAFVAYPLVFRPLAGEHPGSRRLLAASITAAVVALQLGALGVVLQTVLSGISDLRLASFAILMLPLHLAIGVVEGLVTAAVVTFVAKARPEIFDEGVRQPRSGSLSLARLTTAIAIAAVVTGGALSWFASTHPDGLEWALKRATGTQEVSAPEGTVHEALGGLQEKSAVLPDYGLPGDTSGGGEGAWPAVSSETSLSGIVGGILTLLLAAAFGYGAKRIFRKRADA
jgi:cobalt/nickel transport system permease protein